jgi:epoxyqueuosine reductase
VAEAIDPRESDDRPVDTAELLALGRRAGLAAVGVAPATIQQPARTVLHARKAAGRAADMQFTYRNPDRSTDPERLLPGARSLLAGAWGYRAHRKSDQRFDDEPDGDRDGSRDSATAAVGAGTASVARYSWHDHYGDLERALTVMADRLIGAGHRAVVVADSNHLVDRNAAWSAGLGWYGKNSNLLLPGQGSWFVLGTVVTDAELEPTGPPLDDGCGPCSRCIDDCPTQAIVAPGVVDAGRCLAWLVQAGGPIPRHFREAVGDRIYGCDDCQDVCPPNIVYRPVVDDTAIDDTADKRARVDLAWVLSASDDEVLERHGRWYIAGRDVDVIRRTALVVLGNVAEATHPDTEALVRRYLRSPNPMLRGHAVWAAKRLGRDDLLTLVADDEDPAVVEERLAPVTRRSSVEGAPGEPQ